MSLEERRWLLGPSVPDAVKLQMPVDLKANDLKAKLTPDMRLALEQMALELEKGLFYQARPINCPEVHIGECAILVMCGGVTMA